MHFTHGRVTFRFNRQLSTLIVDCTRVTMKTPSLLQVEKKDLKKATQSFLPDDRR